ncbi:MAG: hypothetical protein ACN4GT_00485 [Gammaproteobacteria bacterium]
MGLFSRIFGAERQKSGKNKTAKPAPDFGPDFNARAEAHGQRVAEVLAMQDAEALESFCTAETEIWAALLGFSRLIEVRAELATADTLGAYWERLAGMEAPVFGGGEWRFDPEMFFAAHTHLSADALLHAAGRIDDTRFLDFVISASEIYHLVGDEYLAAVGDPAMLKAKLFSRLESAPPEHIRRSADQVWDLIAEQRDQRAISTDLKRYVEIIGDRPSYRTGSVVDKLTDAGRAFCTASWLGDEAAPGLVESLVRKSLDVDELHVGPNGRFVEEELFELSLLPRALQADIGLGDLTRYEHVPDINIRAGAPDAVLAADRKWSEELQPTRDMGQCSRSHLRRAAGELIHALSLDWEECRQGLTWGNLPSAAYFSVLILCLERENPQVRLNAVRVLIELALVGAIAPEDPGVLHRDDRYESATVDRLAGPLAQLAGGGNDHVRRAALVAARLFPCAALAAPVSASLAWSDSFGNAIASQTVAEWIAAGRTYFHTAETLGRLPGALASWEGGPHAADALDSLNWQAGNDQERIRYAGARRSREKLEVDRSVTDAVLMFDLHSKSYAPIENAIWLFIGLGDPEIIPRLIDTLDEYGTKIMAEAYLNCGNSELYGAAAKWSKRNGYTIHAGRGAYPIGWGAL